MVEEGGVEPPFFLVLPCSYHASLSAPLIPVAHSVRPAFQLPPSYRETLPGPLLILILSTLRKLNLWQTLSIFRSKSLSLHSNSCFT